MNSITPRFIRQRAAPEYLGMDRNRFNAEVRPYLSEILIGIQGIAYDVRDLDAWADRYKAERGRPPRKALKSQAAGKADFERAVKLATAKK